jgi:hypothetical protein
MLKPLAGHDDILHTGQLPGLTSLEQMTFFISISRPRRILSGNQERLAGKANG